MGSTQLKHPRSQAFACLLLAMELFLLQATNAAKTREQENLISNRDGRLFFLHVCRLQWNIFLLQVMMRNLGHVIGNKDGRYLVLKRL